MLRFIPKEEKFYDLFTEAAQNIYEGAELLQKLMGSPHNRQEIYKQIKKLEDKGDEITHEIVRKMNKSFITPFDREDIYALTCRLDDVMDLIDAAAQRFIMFELDQPTEAALNLTQIIFQSCKEIIKAVSELKNLDGVYTHCVELNRLENVADAVFLEALAKLFHDEKNPITIMKLKEIYEDLESATDRCEDVANILEAIVLKSQ